MYFVKYRCNCPSNTCTAGRGGGWEAASGAHWLQCMARLPAHLFHGLFLSPENNVKAFWHCHQRNLCPAEAGKTTLRTQLCSSPHPHPIVSHPGPTPRGTAGGSKWPSPTPALIPGTSGSREGKKAHILYAQRLPLSPGSFVGRQLGISC